MVKPQVDLKSINVLITSMQEITEATYKEEFIKTIIKNSSSILKSAEKDLFEKRRIFDSTDLISEILLTDKNIRKNILRVLLRHIKRLLLIILFYQ